jgi:hypothetical protein
MAPGARVTVADIEGARSFETATLVPLPINAAGGEHAVKKSRPGVKKR